MKRVTSMTFVAVFAMLAATLAMPSISRSGAFGGIAPVGVAAQEAFDCSDIVANGDFESPVISSDAGTDQYDDADFWDGDYWLTGHDPAYSGNQSVYIWEGGSLSQTLDTSGLVTGDTITISFQHDMTITASLNDSSQSWTGGTFEVYQSASLSYTLTSDAEIVTLTFDGTAEPNGSSVDYVTAACTHAAPTATATATATSTPIPTDTATAVPTDTATTVPTDTATAVPTDMATLIPTETPVPTDIATATSIASTSTAAPTATNVSPTSTVTSDGAAAVTLLTSDGGAVPDGAHVCVGDVCQTVGAGSGASAAAASGTTLTFAGLAPGTYAVTVTNAAPYADASSSVTVDAGSTSDLTIILELVVAPTEPGAATPVSTAQPTATVAGPPSGGGVTSPSNPSGNGGSTAGGGGTRVTALPNTGAGHQSPATVFEVLALAVLAIIMTCVLAWRRRVR